MALSWTLRKALRPSIGSSYLLSMPGPTNAGILCNFVTCSASTTHATQAASAGSIARSAGAILVAKRQSSTLSAAVERYLDNLKLRHAGLSEKLSDHQLEPAELMRLGKEYADIGVVVALANERSEYIRGISDLKSIEDEESKRGADGQEMAQLAKSEREELEANLRSIDDQVITKLTPKDAADDRGVVLEVRAGTGGEEASLFASEMFKMYQKYAVLKGWRWEEMSLSKSDIGGFKEAQAIIHGDAVFRNLKFESGVHRVQRVPVNDVKIQTSAASVIVLPEAEEIDVELRPQDLRIDVYRAGGAGGQSVNKTESAVRITHVPTGIQVAMQDERSQIQNRSRAMQYLRARVYDHERQKAMQSRNELRSAAQGTGNRSDKVRTYNFPQDRVTDHRANVTVQGVQRFMSGEAIDDVVDALLEIDDRNSLSNFLQALLKSSS